MKKTFLSLTILGLAIALTSCGGNSESLREIQETLNELKQVEVENVATEEMDLKKVNNTYSIRIPSSFSITTSLNQDASFQYNNLAEEKYFIVIDEGKQEFIDAMVEGDIYNEELSVADNFADIQISGFAAGMTITSQTDVEKRKINGMDARVFSFDAEVQGISFPISYFTAYVVGKERIYTLMGWTLESSKDQYKHQVKGIIHSIKEL